jgi:hypothetical protein
MIGQIRLGLGTVLLACGRTEESVATLEQALIEAPEVTTSWLGLAVGYWDLGRVSEARQFGLKLLAREPGMTISETIRTMAFIGPDMLGKIERGLRGVGVPE